MNYKILKKCLEELNKENFRKDYVIGILETLVGEEEPEQIHWNPEKTKLIVTNKTSPGTSATPAIAIKDEAQFLDTQAKAKLDTVKQMIKYD